MSLKKTKIRFQLGCLKAKALELRRNYQLPYQLVKFINDLTIDSEPEKVQFLMELTKHYLRINGYYKTYKDIEEQSNIDITNSFERRFA